MPERPRLEGKVAIVTGAGSSGPGIGNGKATSLLFAREGAKVLLVDATLERAEETQRMIQEEGGEASVFEADMTNRDDCQAMADAAMERYGHNVGMSMRGTVVDVSEDDWDRIIAVNVKSMIFASGAAIPYMIKSGGGSIINISSIAGLRAHSQTPYTTTKTAVIGLTFSMAADHGKDNIRVNCIAPGLLHTPMTAPRMNDEQREQRKSAAPLGTEGTGWDVGWAAVFLASEEARWITGIVLPVEAGLTVTSPVTYTTIGQQARF